MKRKWSADELIEHWTLGPDELALIRKKWGANQLGFALLLKFFEQTGYFPNQKHEIPRIVQSFVAEQLNCSVSQYQDYAWQGRSIQYHRAEIRDFLGFRPTGVADFNSLRHWLIEEILPQEANEARLRQRLYDHLRELKIEPPTAGRITRLLRSAQRQFETQLGVSMIETFSPKCQQALEGLLGEEDDIYRLDADEFPINQLKAEPGSISLNSLLCELSKLELLKTIDLPKNTFSQLSGVVIERYRIRVETESISELRRHPTSIRLTLLAAFCWQRQYEITDTAIELFIGLVHRLESRAKKRVSEEILRQVQRAKPQDRLLYNIAVAALAEPEGLVKDVIYPIADESVLATLVETLDSGGLTFREQLHQRMRSSYVHHYRRMLPRLLSVLQFRGDAAHLAPLQKAIELLKTYADEPSSPYAADEVVPVEGAIATDWQATVTSETANGETAIDRVAYEIAVLRNLREKLRCKEMWVPGAKRYRNPAHDVPQDFEAKREEYYQALQQPLDVEQFIAKIQTEMTEGLTRLNQGLPTNPKVQILDKRGGWIQLTPLTPQADPANLAKLKDEIARRWPVTPLLDILKGDFLKIRYRLFGSN
jgi:Domain of unknown function (DUF4158)